MKNKSFLLFLVCLWALFFSGDNPIARLEKYIEQHKSLAQYCQKTYNVPASITLARAILESGGGVSFIAKESNNHFGIMFDPQDYYAKICGPYHYFQSANGNKWRRYDTIEDAYIDHAQFFHLRVGSTCRWPFNKPTDYRIWSKTIGWCIGSWGMEDPEKAAKEYEQNLNAIIQRHRLDRFDILPDSITATTQDTITKNN